MFKKSLDSLGQSFTNCRVKTLTEAETFQTKEVNVSSLSWYNGWITVLSLPVYPSVTTSEGASYNCRRNVDIPIPADEVFGFSRPQFHELPRSLFLNDHYESVMYSKVKYYFSSIYTSTRIFKSLPHTNPDNHAKVKIFFFQKKTMFKK